jgi:PKD repeat protein
MKLSNIPSDIEKFIYLKKLLLWKNDSLTSVPYELGTITSLSKILFGDVIKVLPDSFKNGNNIWLTDDINGDPIFADYDESNEELFRRAGYTFEGDEVDDVVIDDDSPFLYVNLDNCKYIPTNYRCYYNPFAVSYSGGEISYYTLKFGDEFEGFILFPDINRPYVEYNNPGTYNFSITAYDTNGYFTTQEFEIVAYEEESTTTPENSIYSPTVTISSSKSSVYTNESLQFNSQASDQDGNIVSYVWDFKDGTTSTQANPSHSFTTSGTYVVTCRVTDNDGLFSQTSITINVQKPENIFPEIIDWSMNASREETFYVGDTIKISNVVAQDSDGQIASYIYHFADQKYTSTQNSFTHILNTADAANVICWIYVSAIDNDGAIVKSEGIPIFIFPADQRPVVEDTEPTDNTSTINPTDTIINISVSKTSTYIPTTLNLSATVNNPDNLNLVYTWDITNVDKNMNFYSPQGLIATFDAYEAGSYNISFRVNDTNGEQIAIKTTSITLSKDVESKFSSPTATSDQGNIALEYDRTYYRYSFQSEQEYNNITISGLSQSQCVSANISGSTSSNYSNCGPSGATTSFTIPKINKGDYVSIHTAIKTFTVTSTDSIKLTFSDLVEAGRSDHYVIYPSSTLTNLKITNDQKINDSDHQYIGASERVQDGWQLHENYYETLENGILIPSLPASSQWGYGIYVDVSFDQGGGSSSSYNGATSTDYDINSDYKLSEISVSDSSVDLSFIHSTSNFSFELPQNYSSVIIKGEGEISGSFSCFTIDTNWENHSCLNNTDIKELNVGALSSGSHTINGLVAELKPKIIADGVDITNQVNLIKTKHTEFYEINSPSTKSNITFTSSKNGDYIAMNAWDETGNNINSNSNSLTFDTLKSGMSWIQIHYYLNIPASDLVYFEQTGLSVADCSNTTGCGMGGTCCVGSEKISSLDGILEYASGELHLDSAITMTDTSDFVNIGNSATPIQFITIGQGAFVETTCSSGSFIVLTSGTTEACSITFSGTNETFYIVYDTQAKRFKTATTESLLDTESETSSNTLSLIQGWNLVSAPVQVSFQHISSDTPPPIGVQGFSSFGDYDTIWTYSSQGWAKNPSNITHGKGMWIKMISPKIIEFSGSSYSPSFGSLEKGWNLMGTGEVLNNIKTSQSLDTVWAFVNGAWKNNPSTINPGQGFWVKK